MVLLSLQSDSYGGGEGREVTGDRKEQSYRCE